MGLNFFHQHGWRRLAMLMPTDATGQDGEQSLDAALARPENHDITVVAREHFNISGISVAAQVAHIEATKPDVLYAWTTWRAARDGASRPPIRRLRSPRVQLVRKHVVLRR